MFRCQRCGQLSYPGEQPVRVVTKTRDKIYPVDTYHRSIGSGSEIVVEERWRLSCVGPDGGHIGFERFTFHARFIRRNIAKATT